MTQSETFYDKSLRTTSVLIVQTTKKMKNKKNKRKQEDVLCEKQFFRTGNTFEELTVSFVATWSEHPRSQCFFQSRILVRGVPEL
jgi:hypothetical protein